MKARLGQDKEMIGKITHKTCLFRGRIKEGGHKTQLHLFNSSHFQIGLLYYEAFSKKAQKKGTHINVSLEGFFSIR